MRDPPAAGIEYFWIVAAVAFLKKSKFSKILHDDCFKKCDTLLQLELNIFESLQPCIPVGAFPLELSQQAFLNKRPPAPGLVWTWQKILAHGRDLVVLSCGQDFAENINAHTRFQEQRSKRRSSLGHMRFSQPMVRTSLSHLESKVYANRFAPQPILKKRTPALELSWACQNLLAHGRDLTFLSCCQRPGRKHLTPNPFSKTKALVPKLAWTCQIFLAHGQDLTFPSCVQCLCVQICHHNHFWKTEHRHLRSAGHVNIY